MLEPILKEPIPASTFQQTSLCKCKVRADQDLSLSHENVRTYPEKSFTQSCDALSLISKNKPGENKKIQLQMIIFLNIINLPMYLIYITFNMAHQFQIVFSSLQQISFLRKSISMHTYGI